jgi:HK97 gp10 family phage protein
MPDIGGFVRLPRSAGGLPASGVELHGFKELEQKLRRMPDKIGGKILEKAVREASKTVGMAARRLAPKADQVYTVRGGAKVEPGRLKKSITWKRKKGFDKRKVAFSIKPRKLRGKTVYYWTFVEFGRTYKYKGRMRSPFMRPAFARNKQKAINVMRDRLRDEIYKQARR